jgi:DNA-binding response OmpR family regulator
MSSTYLIGVMSSNVRNVELVSEVLKKEGYRTRGVNSIIDLDDLLKAPERPSAILLDLSGFDRTIWERCERIREAQIPFIIISPNPHVNVKKEGIAQGARGILVKPLVIKDLIQLVRSLLPR